MTQPSQPHRHTNHLARESSPYLLQHAHNPVDWHAWGTEAFELSRKENKPIFLSVGYSTCYWCHVMERQSFENEAVAAEMNKRFINIKVDREERPDVDQLYMTAVQVLTRHGGWPMSVFLTPDLRPFYGGTYFPPTDVQGRPGFVTILRGIEEAYRDRPADVEKTANQLVKILGQYAEPGAAESPLEIDHAFVESLIRRSVADYDPRAGGFGGAPKFPRETLLELLLVYLHGSPPMDSLKPQVSQMLRHTLDALAAGGIHDQLGGGFHRYSTDAHWLVPHFEIMLYDNAMLAWCYVEAFRQTGEPRYAQVARGVFDFVLREMTSPNGGFYTAFDAEVDSQEGLNYLWTAEQIEALLGSEDARVFNKAYGVDRGPNFADPHHGSGVPDQNILFLPQPLAKAAADLGTDSATLESRLAPMRQKLYAARSRRKQPLLDTKVITSWNALMIRALAHGGSVLGDARYTAAASKAARFLLETNSRDGLRLYRTSRDGTPRYDAFLDDYAFLAQALLSIHQVTGDATWKEKAAALTEYMLAEFGDQDRGGFYFTQRGATDLIVRQKTASDSPLPSGNAIAAMVLLELGHVAEARKTLALFAQQLDNQGEGMSAMVQAALLFLRKAGSFTVPGPAEADVSARPLSPSQVAHEVVTVRTEWKTPAELLVHVGILRGFHISAHDVAPEMGLIVTSLKVEDEPAAQVVYPPGEPVVVAFANHPLRVYGGEVTLTVRFPIPRKVGEPVRLSLVYQACDESACLPPVTKFVVVP